MDWERAVSRFRRYIAAHMVFQEVYSIVERNSDPPHYLIGGSVYRTLSHFLHGDILPLSDWDFLVGDVVEDFVLPERWERESTDFGNPRFHRGFTFADVVPLNNVFSIRDRGLPATLDNYLSGTPLNVHSIAFDLSSEEVIGDVGIDAIKNRTVAVNYLRDAEREARRKGVHLDRYVLAKAEDLDYRAILP